MYKWPKDINIHLAYYILVYFSWLCFHSLVLISLPSLISITPPSLFLLFHKMAKPIPGFLFWGMSLNPISYDCGCPEPEVEEWSH